MRWCAGLALGITLGAIVPACGELCDGAESYCVGRELHYCDDQHDDMHWTATSCAQQCVESAGGAQCAAEAQPRAACAEVPVGVVVCDGADRVTCGFDGYPREVTTCADPGLCEPAFPWGCTALPGPQAECQARTGDDVWDPSYCLGNARVTCADAWALAVTDCGAEVCQQTSQVALCAQPTPDPACANPDAPLPYGVCRDNVYLTCLGPYLAPGFSLDCGAGTCTANGCSQ